VKKSLGNDDFLNTILDKIPFPSCKKRVGGYEVDHEIYLAGLPI
jgi:hypothetical protein